MLFLLLLRQATFNDTATYTTVSVEKTMEKFNSRDNASIQIKLQNSDGLLEVHSSDLSALIWCYVTNLNHLSAYVSHSIRLLHFIT